MTKRVSLKDQLLEISKPAPKDFDPEDSYATYAQESSKANQEDLENGRKDYVDVGESKLRKKGEAIVDEKYSGKKSSRKDIFDLDDDLGADPEEEEEGDDFEDDEGDFEDLEGESEEEEEEEEEEESPPPPLPRKKSKSVPVPSLEQEEKKMMSDLKSAASADVEKGRSVKKQLAFCDNILEARIKLQPAFNAINSLPHANNATSYFSLIPSEIRETLAEVDELQEELFTLREELLVANEKIDLPSKFGNKRKRSRQSDEFNPEEYLRLTLADLTTFDTTLTPFLRTTLSKWSDKVLSASGLLSKSSTKFAKQSLAQNALAQVDHILGSESEMERLVKRSRVDRRETGRVVGKVELMEDDREKKGDEECFDDGDWYAQILRDLVESRLLDLDDPTMAALRLASSRSKKTKKVVDTRASKGRKIRYHVHEKMQNFMIPIEAGGWHDEQIDELFAGLLGRSAGERKKIAVQEEDGQGEGEGEKMEVGNLRLF